MLRDVDDFLAGRIDRRGLLRGGAGLALGAGLAGCGVGDSGGGSKEDTEKVVKAKVDGDLVYFNWSEYLDPELIKDFEKKYGVKVRQSNFDSMASMLAKLRSGNRYDIIFPDQSVTPRLVAHEPAAQARPRPAEELRPGLRVLPRPRLRPGLRAHGALRDVRHRRHLARGQDQRHDRVLGRPLPRGRQGQDLRARRLPGGHRDGQLQERLRAERVRRTTSSTRRSRR